MTKKKAIVSSSILLLVIIAGAAIWLWQKNIQENDPLGKLIIMKDNLTPATIQEYQRLFEAAKKDIESDPGKYMAWIQIGQTKMLAGDYLGAERAWRHIAALKPDAVVAFSNLGHLYGYLLHDYPKAEAAYLEAVKRDPQFSDYYVSLSDIYLAWPEKKALAEQILITGLEKKPDDPYLLGALAGYYRNNGQTDKAIEFYQKLLKVDPTNTEAKQALAALKK